MPKYKTNMPKYKANMPKYKTNMPKYKANMPKYNTNMPKYKTNPSTPLGQDVLEPQGDRVYPIPLTPFPMDPPPANCGNTCKNSHVL